MYTPKFTLGNIPKKVKLGDITVRDGFQHEEYWIPTDTKLWFVEQALKAGFKEIELTNFGNPKAIPQFKDCWEVTEGACKLRERAVEKGWIKMQNFKNNKNKLAYTYLLTPTGIEEKAKVTIRYLKSKMEEYEILKHEIDELSKETQDVNLFKVI